MAGTAVLVLPVTREIPVPPTDPATIFQELGTRPGFILESMEGVPRRAVRSIIGFEPDRVVEVHDDERTGEKGYPPGPGVQGEYQDPMSRIRALLSGYRLHGEAGHDFIGGFVGYCSYDLVTALTDRRVNAGMSERPLARFMVSTRGIIFDHVRDRCTLFDDLVLVPGDDPVEKLEQAVERMKEREEQVHSLVPREVSGSPADPGERVRNDIPPLEDRDRFMGAVMRAQEYIRAGEIFQVVLSRQIQAPFRGDPMDIYAALRSINPSPYLYFLDFGDEAIIGSSPEMLVSVRGSSVATVPIAGTRPRGLTQEEDDALGRDLLADEKERAEHLMLVDLARNDIGRVSVFGSVTVPEFMEIERFSHVQHIVSRVSGTLRDGCDRFDALRSCFPAGTVSGAPKVRAMQIIAELEGQPRGLYAGAVGYAGFNEILEFAIAIRTITVKNGVAAYASGAGIVADSVPEREFEETESKARAMMQAVLSAGGA